MIETKNDGSDAEMGKRTAVEMEFVKERYKFVDGMLGELEKLIDDKGQKETIQAKYKEVKHWFEAEYRELSKVRHGGGYVETIYVPLITDIFVQSFDLARTNSPIEKIELAMVNGRDYFIYWCAQLKATALK